MLAVTNFIVKAYRHFSRIKGGSLLNKCRGEKTVHSETQMYKVLGSQRDVVKYIFGATFRRSVGDSICTASEFSRWGLE